MTSLFQARRRAEEFAAAVDGQAEGRPAVDEELVRLLGLVDSLRGQGPVEPRPDFAADLRSRLMQEARTALRPETANLLLPTRERGRRERRLVAAASAFVLVGGTATMAAAASSSLPGEALYPVKRGIERAEAGLNFSDAGKGRDLLSQAADRLVEVEGLLSAESVQSVPRVPQTLAEFSASAAEGSALLFDAFRESGDPETIVAVRSFTTEGITTLEQLADRVPDDAQDELAAAALLLDEIDNEAAALCGGCASELPEVEVPGIFLARAEVDAALTRAAGIDLENSHPVVVPKGAVPAAPRPAPSAEATPTPGQSPAPPSPAGPAPLPSPSLGQPDSWPSLLPGLGDGTNTKNDTENGEKSVADEIAEGLTDAVETILPDVDVDLAD